MMNGTMISGTELQYLCSPAQYGGIGTTLDLFLYIENINQHELALLTIHEMQALALSVSETATLYERPPDGYMDWNQYDEEMAHQSNEELFWLHGDWQEEEPPHCGGEPQEPQAVSLEENHAHLTHIRL